MTKKRTKKKNNGAAAIGGIVFVGCIMMGMAFGAAIDDRSLGLYSGLGIGFIAMAIVWYLLRKTA